MKAAKIDANQAEIVQALEKIGASVVSLAGVGRGCPDLLVSYHGETVLLEIKNRDGRGIRLTPAQVEFHANWKGQIAIVTTTDEALKVPARNRWRQYASEGHTPIAHNTAAS